MTVCYLCVRSPRRRHRTARCRRSWPRVAVTPRRTCWVSGCWQMCHYCSSYLADKTGRHIMIKVCAISHCEGYFFYFIIWRKSLVKHTYFKKWAHVKSINKKALGGKTPASLRSKPSPTRPAASLTLPLDTIMPLTSPSLHLCMIL